MASSWGWWTLSASLSVNVMACSSMILSLGDHPKSWTFCTTFKYVFLDLDDWLVEPPLMITLISPSGSHDDSSTFPFNFSSLWSCPRKFLNFPCLIRFSICCFRSNHSSVSCLWSLWKRQYLFLLRLFGSPFIFSDYFKEGIVLDLHKNLLEWHVQWSVLLIPCWMASLFVVSVFLIFRSSFLWTRTLFRVAVCFHSLNSFPLLGYDCVFYIHKVLGRMDEFSHGLRFLLVKIMDE